MKQVEKAAELFSLGVEALARKHGTSEVAAALKQYNEEGESPNLEFSKEIEKFITDEEMISEVAPAAAAGAATLAGMAPAVLGTLDTVTDAVSGLMTRDVDITDISTSKSLNVASPSLQKLVSSTNDSIEKMTKTLALIGQDLSTRLQDVDVSIDDIVASETGESSAEISKRQRTRRGRAKPQSKDKKDEKGQEPVLRGSPVG